ncbi:PAS domain S-box protein, partial [Roseateles sp. GG27B]
MRADDIHQSNASAVRDAHEAIVTVDERQTIVMINPAAQRMFGFTVAEALGSDLSSLIPKRFRTTHTQHAYEFDAAGETEANAGKDRCLYGLRADGQEFPVSVKISRVATTSNDRSHRFYTAVLYDLSAEHRLKEEIET